MPNAVPGMQHILLLHTSNPLFHPMAITGVGISQCMRTWPCKICERRAHLQLNLKNLSVCSRPWLCLLQLIALENISVHVFKMHII